ncbi:MAG: hypothetical protein GX256_10655 [Fretibacterium sp.]|nr:hypothetical protein [Fretibacterium sp.]
MELFGYFCVVTLILAVGDLVSARTRGVLPALFVASALFLFGFWSGYLPKNIVQEVGLGAPLADFAMSLMVVQMGSTLSPRRLIAEWRSIAIAASGLAGMIAFLLIFGRMLIAWETIAVAAPPLTGGLVAATMMVQAATERGFSSPAVLATVIYVLQGFLSYPLTAWLLRLEGRRLLEIRRTDPHLLRALPEESPSERVPFFSALQQTTPFTRIALIALVALAATGASGMLEALLTRISPALKVYTPHPLVLCFLFGCLATRYRITDRRPLARTSSIGFLAIILTAHVMSFLQGATPGMILSSLYELLVAIGVGATGLLCFAAASSRFFGYSIPMAAALSLTAFSGFPQNFLLADESARHLSENAEEYDFLMQHTLPQMLVGGFVTIMIASVVIAELFVRILG